MQVAQLMEEVKTEHSSYTCQAPKQLSSAGGGIVGQRAGRSCVLFENRAFFGIPHLLLASEQDAAGWQGLVLAHKLLLVRIYLDCVGSTSAERVSDKQAAPGYGGWRDPSSS